MFRLHEILIFLLISLITYSCAYDSTLRNFNGNLSSQDTWELVGPEIDPGLE